MQRDPRWSWWLPVKVAHRKLRRPSCRGTPTPHRHDSGCEPSISGRSLTAMTGSIAERLLLGAEIRRGEDPNGSRAALPRHHRNALELPRLRSLRWPRIALRVVAVQQLGLAHLGQRHVG